MTREILLESLKANLRVLSLEDFSKLFINEAQAIEEFYKLCHGISAGKTISLLFNPHRLSTVSIHNNCVRSIYDGLQQDASLNGLARLYLYNLEHGVNNAFYSAVQRGFEGIPYINEFPPIVARNIVMQYGIDKRDKTVIKILDPCAGWGGRMIGCASILNVSYTACEPSTMTFNGLQKLGSWLKLLQPSFSFDVKCLPYEDLECNEQFDIALTSPPYYDTEHYSDEPTNSLNRYKSFDDWVEGFYKPLILTTMERVKDDGVFILNVGDRKYPLSQSMFKVCEDAGLYCSRIRDYLSGNGEGKEKFYCISKKQKIATHNKLF